MRTHGGIRVTGDAPGHRRFGITHVAAVAVLAVAGAAIFPLLTLAEPAPRPIGGPRATSAEGADPELRALARKYRRPARIPAPSGNAMTPARVRLGKKLFFDPRLSGSQTMSCASCHNPSLSWTDGNPVALGNGMKPLTRRTPTLLNVAWATSLFWDGRVKTLEEQALIPITAPAEMNGSLAMMTGRLQMIRGYKALFAAAYPGEPISPPVVAKALAAFERSIVSGTAPFDRWVAGDERAISAEAKEGFRLFNGKARCADCHSTWRFTDDSLHDIGWRASADSGRARDERRVAALFAFKTPTLRNVVERSPYMHDGTAEDLEDVIEFYDRGGERRPSLSPKMHKLRLTEDEEGSLMAFLRTLTSVDPTLTLPVLPR